MDAVGIAIIICVVVGLVIAAVVGVIAFMAGSSHRKKSAEATIGSAEEEAKVMENIRNNVEGAREPLITHNLRLVVYISKKFESSFASVEDLISIGTIGLMKAVDTFDSTRRARFSTYASRCIENAILSPAHFGMEKRIHLFHAMTHLRQNGFFGAERAVPFFCFRGCHVRVVV